MEHMKSGNRNGTGTGTSELKTVLWVSMTKVDLGSIFILIRCIHFLINFIFLFDRGKIHVNDATHFRFRIPCFNATGYIVDYF